MMEPVRWERVDRETAFEGRVFDVWRDRVRIARDGSANETVVEVVHHPGAVAIVALDDAGAVVLLRQFRYAAGGEIWEIPAGTLEEGESPEATAERELAEEAGLRAARWTSLVTVYTTPGFCDEEMRVFLAEGLTEASGERDADELFGLARVPLTDALAWCASGEIRDAKTIVGLYAARERLERDGRWPPRAR